MRANCILISLAAASASVLRFQRPAEVPDLTDTCSNYQNMDTCRGNQVDYPESIEQRRWQTPPPSSADYASPTWQHYRNLQGYAQVLYAADRQSAKVKMITLTREPTRILYRFGITSEWTEESSVVAKPGIEEGLVITAWAPELGNATLVLDPLYFTWQNAQVSAHHNGQKGAIVELFGWPYKDIAQECSTFLGKAGYMGVKIFPAQEHIETYHYLQNGELNPWYLTYQPVSYRLHSRLGTREELREMIDTCRSNGVRVYADAVVNHMTGSGNDVLTHRNPAGGSCVHWGAKNASGGSPYFTHSWTFEPSPFTGERPALEFPAVPYGPADFHCERALSDWGSGFSLNYGWLVGLTDLNTEREYVQQRIADYMTDLISIGFSGFRVDAAKHIRPDDLAAIFGKLKRNLGGSFPDDFLSWLEVIIGGERDLLACQHNPYNYYTYLDEALARNGLAESEIAKIKIWSSDYPKEHPICGRWIIPSERFVIQNDDHDQQNPGSSSRDMADKGSVLIKDRDVSKHRAFEKELFERRDGNWAIRLILSSFMFPSNGAQGYPDGKSDCKKYLGNPYTSPNEKCKTVEYRKAHRPESCGYDMAPNEYTRVHRDREIILAMRRWSNLATDNLSIEDLGLPAEC